VRVAKAASSARDAGKRRKRVDGKSTVECVALLRGINVGKAKRIAMADLRDLVERLGFANVRTLLNSGNVVFSADRSSTSQIAASIEAAIEKRCGFSSRVVVVDAAALDKIIDRNPLREVATDPSKHLVAFAASAAGLAKVKPLLAQDWAPDELAIVDKAAYLWCAKGILKSNVAPAFMRAVGEGATTRNWATVLKLQSMMLSGASE
jgi:uncharacterized protein (DUF1697 family)